MSQACGVVIAAVLMLAVGCSPAVTYNDALARFNAESEALTRLEEQLARVKSEQGKELLGVEQHERAQLEAFARAHPLTGVAEEHRALAERGALISRRSTSEVPGR